MNNKITVALIFAFTFYTASNCMEAALQMCIDFYKTHEKDHQKARYPLHRGKLGQVGKDLVLCFDKIEQYASTILWELNKRKSDFQSTIQTKDQALTQLKQAEMQIASLTADCATKQKMLGKIQTEKDNLVLEKAQIMQQMRQKDNQINLLQTDCSEAHQNLLTMQRKIDQLIQGYSKISCILSLVENLQLTEEQKFLIAMIKQECKITND